MNEIAKSAHVFLTYLSNYFYFAYSDPTTISDKNRLKKTSEHKFDSQRSWVAYAFK